MSYLYDGWLKISEGFNGNRRFEILEDKEASGALVEDQEGKLLLVRQHRVALGQETLEIPAGCLDKDGLSPTEIMVEELAEEANLIIDEKDLELMLVGQPNIGVSKSRYFLYHYLYPGLGQDEKITDDPDVTERLWVTSEDFLRLIQEGGITDMKSQLAFFLWKSKLDGRPR